MNKYKTLREEAYEANMEIKRKKLAIYTWGNSSAFDPDMSVFAIKPSGVDYESLKPKLMVVIDLYGNVVDGNLKPSSDTKTHLVLYREFSQLGIRGITHTHSTYATAWAQAARSVPIFGTTHADHGTNEIPCTDFMSEEKTKNNYELETGNLIIDTFKQKKLNPAHTNMVLTAGHGPFTWGNNAALSVYNSVVMEEICKMAFITLSLNPLAKPLPEHIIKKHWERKHGEDAYYGQNHGQNNIDKKASF